MFSAQSWTWCTTLSLPQKVDDPFLNTTNVKEIARQRVCMGTVFLTPISWWAGFLISMCSFCSLNWASSSGVGEGAK